MRYVWFFTVRAPSCKVLTLYNLDHHSVFSQICQVLFVDFTVVSPRAVFRRYTPSV